MKQKIKQLQSLLLLLILTVVGTASAWGDTKITWTPSSSDISTLTGSTGANISVGTSSNIFKIYAVRNSTNNDQYTSGEGLKFNDNALYKSGIAVYVPSTSNDIASIEFYLRTTNTSRQIKYVALDAIGLSSDPAAATALTLTTNYASYSPFASPVKSKYYTVGGRYNGSGDIYLQKVVVTFSDGGTPTCSTPSISCTDNAVSISSATDGASIRYTTDGTDPTSSSGTVYSAPFTINEAGTKTIKAIAYKTSYNDSEVASQSFTIYSVTYNGNDPTTGTAPSTAYYVSGSNVTVASNTGSLAKTEYTFVGWNTSTTGTVSSQYGAGDTYPSIAGNVTFYAVWKHQVNLAVNDESMGSVSAVYGTGGDTYYGKSAGDDFTSGGYVTDGTKLTITANPNDGYHFDTTGNGGRPWGTATSGTDNPQTNFEVKSGKTFTAYFAANTYQVAFNANGGTGSAMSNQNFTYGSAQSLTANTYTRTGYTFDGWATSAGGDKVYNDEQSVGNLTTTNGGTVTLYAHWSASNITITLDKNGGTADGSATATYGSNVLSSVTDATRTGYTLLGYYTTTDGNVQVIDANDNLVASVSGYTDASGNWTRNEATTLYAHWEAIVVGSQKFHFVGATSGSGTYTPSADLKNITTSDAASVLDSGTMQLFNNKENTNDQWSTSGIQVNSNNDYLKITLTNGTFAVGDVITVDATQELCFTNNGSYSATNITSNKTYTITSTDGLAGSNTIYVHRGVGSGTWIKEITINSASGEVTTYTVHYNVGGKATTISDATKQTALANPLPTPTGVTSGYTFEGWYTDAAFTTPAEAGATISAETTLYANYIITAPTMSPASGALTTGDEMTLTSTVSFTNAYMGWSTNSTPLAIRDEGMIHQYSGDARTTMQVTAPAMSGTLYFTWIISDGTFYSQPTNAEYTITVPVTEVTLNKTATSLTIGSTETLTATITPSTATNKTLTWISGDPTVATVSASGVVTAVGVGTATISAVATQGTEDTSDDVTSVGCVVSVSSGAVVSSGLFSTNFTGNAIWGEDNIWSSSDNTVLDGSATANTVVYGITFRDNATGGFVIEGTGADQHMKFRDNASSNRWFAIPLTNIEGGRIDVYIKTSYASNSGFKFKMYFDGAHGTTVQESTPGSLSTPTFDYVENFESKGGFFHFRIKDLLVKSGVLYMGPTSSSFREIQAVKITTSETNFSASPSSVTTGDDTSTPIDVTILNNTAFVPSIKTEPNEAVATAVYDRSEGILKITPVGAGTTNVVMYLDDNMNGSWDEGETTTINIPITVNTISISGQPVSAVYATDASASNLSVTASVASGTLKYQWYKNTVNSTTGGTAISGATNSTYKPSTSATEEAAFYYCELSADGYQTKYSDVAYVLTSSTYRYFHMSNVAGNRQTSDATEVITGEVIAGGSATAVYGSGTGTYYRYITRPATSNPHMYVVKNADNYIKVNLDKAISTNDLITIRLMGYAGTDRGIKIATDASGSNAISIVQDVTSEKVYQTTFNSNFNGKTEIYILGIYAGEQNYFTDFYISAAEALKVSAPTPAVTNTQVGETPTPLTVIASGGTGSYTYQWKQCDTEGGTYTDVSTGTGYTTASFTPATTSAGTTYYKCYVTSGGSNVTSSSAKVVVAAVAHGWYTPTYTSGVATYVLNKSNYDADNGNATATLTTNYWKNDTKVSFPSNTISTVSASADNYVQLKSGSSATYMTFYVKNAVAFSLVGTSSNKTVKVIVNGKTVKSGLTINNTESEIFALRKTDGDTITINSASGNVSLGRLTFYEKPTPTISVEKGGEAVTEATQYLGDGTVDYEIISNSTGSISSVTSGDTGVATVSYNSTTGVLTVTSVAEGTATITINQNGDSNYSAGSTTFTVTVAKHSLALAFSYAEASFAASRLTEDEDIPAEKLPTLSVLLDGVELTDEQISDKGIAVKYKSDDTSVASFGDETDYTITYEGGQGSATIYAYVDAMSGISAAKTTFTLVVSSGTNNKLSSGESISPQQSYMVKNSDGVELVRVIYGGFKYGGEGNNKHQYNYGGTVTDKWSSATAHNASIDGFKYYTKNGDNDAMNEYFHNIYCSMTEVYKDSKNYTHDMKDIWYQKTDLKPDGETYYQNYERVKPFALPCRADYLKFEPMKTGKLTVYVIQNGVLGRSKKKTQLGTRPRVGYWFDQDGWRIQPIVDPVSKHVLGADQGRDNHTYDDNGAKTYEEQMDYYWGSYYDYTDMPKLLKYDYCSEANPTTATDESAFSNTKNETFKYDNPYRWPKNTEVNNNRKEIIPSPMVPVPYHGGYMMFEEAFVKYTINVIAGKTYYFTGSSTKVGYVGLNFVEDNSVLTSNGIAHNENTLHLTADDKMNEYKFGGSDVPLTQSTLYDEVTLPSNYKNNQWSAICLPFALSEKQVEEAFGYGTELTLYNGLIKKGTDYTVKFLTHVDQNILPGQPYFIRPTGVDKDGNDLPHVDEVIGSNATGAADGKIRLTFNTVLIDINNLKQAYASYGSNANVDVDGKKTGEASYVFTGSYAPVDPLTKYSYIMNAGILRRYTGSKLKFPTYMAYIAPESVNAKNGSMSFHADFEDNVIERTWIDDDNDAPTSVITIEEIADAMNAAERKNSDKTYNVMGQQIDPRSAKGLVIKNGKKYIFE